MASGVGTVRLRVPGNGSDLVLTDVLYVPTFPVNLFSRVMLYTSGGTICGKTSTLRDRLNEVICEIDISVEGIFLKASSSHPTALYVDEDELRAKEKLMHRRLCHLGYENVRKTVSLTKGVKLNFSRIPPESKHPCYTCDIAKSMRKVSRKPQKRALHAFDVIHTDVVGAINPIGKNGHRWVVIYTDDATRAR
jgi:hypothetical protein